MRTEQDSGEQHAQQRRQFQLFTEPAQQHAAQKDHGQTE